MDPSLISAVAALVGAAIGAVSLARSWLIHHQQLREQWLSQDGLQRQDLYKEFIEEASRCYLHALQHHQPDISLLVVLYAKMNRMRVVASPELLAAAENAIKRIIDTYSEPDLTFTGSNLRVIAQQGAFDVLVDFSESCRAEFEFLRQLSFDTGRVRRVAHGESIDTRTAR
jgi:hypothetical protein